MASGMQGARNDRILYWPVVLTVAWPLLFVLVCFIASLFTWAGLSALFFLPLQALVLTLWGASGLFACLLCLEWVYTRAWRRLLSTLVLALTVAVAALNVKNVWHAGQTAGDYAHLFLMYPKYRADIAELPAGEPRFMVWEWGGFASHGSGVAYDESDEIASDHPSKTWQERADRYGVLGHGYPRTIGHFYFVDLH